MSRGIIRSHARAAQSTPPRHRVLRRRARLAVLAWLAGLAAWLPPGADRFERELALPWLFATRGALPAPREASLVAIDTQSAQRLGLSAGIGVWPRHVLAALIRRAAQAGAAVIALDVYLADAGVPQDDAALEAAIRDAGNVVLFGRLQREVSGLPGAGADGQVQVDRLQAPYAPFAKAAAAVAPFVLPKSPARVDTVWTHHPAAPELPTLPAAALVVQAGDVSCPPGARGGRVRLAVCGLRAAPAERLLNFYGPPRTLDIVPAADLLLGPLPDFAGRAVFIGHVEPYFPNQTDSFLTAVSRPDGLDLSGVEIAATAYLNFLRGESLRTPPAVAVLLALAVSGVLLAPLFLWIRPGAMAPLVLVLLVGNLGGVLLMFSRGGWWWPIAPGGAQVLVAAFGALGWRALHSGRERAQLAAAFRQYLPAHVVRQVARANDSSPPLATTRQRAVCLVSDATGYTSVVERLPAAALRDLVNRYYAALLAPIGAEGGIVTDIVGDSALALWPISRTGVAQRLRACRAALGVQDALAGFAVPGGGDMPTRIGLHAGDLLLGPVGALDHYEYRAIGDVVNTASRIEALNKQLGTRILASEEVVGGLVGMDFRRVGRFRLAGKSQLLVIHELMHVPTEAEARARPLFEAALDAFTAGDAVSARRAFEASLALNASDGVAAFYLDLLRDLQRHDAKLPPDGVLVLPK
jgi:adenylate cyclase